MPRATAAHVSPLTADDWEILEMNAEFVEQHMLSQVRAVYPGQTICVWVGKGKTLVRFNVDSFEPEGPSAALLTRDSEIIISPKTRVDPLNAKHDISSHQEPSSTPSNDWTKHLFRLLPLPYIGNYDEFANLPFVRHYMQSTDITSEYVCFAFVNELCWSNFLVKHLDKTGKARIHWMKQVSWISQVSGAEKKSEKPRDNGEQENRKNATSKRKGNKEEESVDIIIVPCPSELIPEGHIWIDEKSRRSLGIDESPWELVKISSSEESKTKKTDAAASYHAGSPKNGISIPLDIDSKVTPKVSLDESLDKSDSLPGFKKYLDECTQFILQSLLSRKNGYSASGLLLCGNSGSGKTAFLETLSRQLSKDRELLPYIHYQSCSKMSDERFPSLKVKIQTWFDTACWHAPSILFLDDIDRMLPNQVEHIDPFRSQQLASTFVSIAKKALEERPILLVASSQSPSSFHHFLSSSHLFGKRIILRAPDKTARKEIISEIVEDKKRTSKFLTEDFDPVAVSTLTDGYLPSDIRDLIDRAIHKAAIRLSEKKLTEEQFNLTLDDFMAAQSSFVPISLRDVKLQKSDVLWADIGGLRETKKVLRETLEWPTKYGAIFASSPLRLRSGLLLYGYPGCGKTLLASAVAKECGLNFISVKGPELLNKYIGASEKSVRDLFERAQAAKPCVLFFDEFDSIAPKRGHDSTGVTDRVVNQMLTQMDGAEGLEGVYVLAATSRPDLIDPALLRPGRLDKSLLCSMPDEEERFEIMEACSRKLSLSPNVDLTEYAKFTEGYTGADLQALIYNAHLDCVHSSLPEHVLSSGTNEDANGNDELEYVTFGGPSGENSKTLSRAEKSQVDKRLEAILQNLDLDQGATDLEGDKRPEKRKQTIIESLHMSNSFNTTRPSVPRQEVVRLKRIYDEFVSGRSSSGGLPSGEASDKIGGRTSLM